MLDIQIQNGNNWYSLDFKDINLSLNYNVINLTNPSKYVTEYSKSLDLPLTENNLKALSFTSRLDSVMTTSMSITRGIPARIFNDGDLIFEGKYSVTKVDVSKETVTGNLYGTVNDWYNKLKNINFGTELPEVLSADYVIDRTTVINSFARRPSIRETTLALPGENNYNAHDFIGWAPTINGETNNFDSKSMLNNDGEIVKVWEAFGLTGDDASNASAIVESPSERMMLQYRSYNMKPYFYIDKLTQLIKNYADSQSDIPDIYLDYTWFNESNPMYANVVYLLPNLISESEETQASRTTLSLNASAQLPQTVNASGYLNSMASDNAYVSIFNKILPFETHEQTSLIDSQGRIVGNGTQLDIRTNVTLGQINWRAVQNWNANAGDGMYWNNPQVTLAGNLRLIAYLIDANGTEINDTRKTLKEWSGSDANMKDRNVTQTSINNYDDSVYYNWNTPSETFLYDISVSLGASSTARLKVEYQYKRAGYWTNLGQMSSQVYTLWRQGNNSYYYVGNYPYQYSRDVFLIGCGSTTSVQSTSLRQNGEGSVEYSQSARSGRSLKITDIWKNENENSPFKVFVKYCKMMNLVFDYDMMENRLYVLPREKFFYNYVWNINQGFNFPDWTNKIDYKSDMTFKPVQWDKKYVIFNYESSDADRLSDFEDRYGYAYGGKKIKTSYEYNSDEENLFEDDAKINASAEMSEYLYSCWDVYNTVTVPSFYPEAKLMNEAFIINRKENSSADMQNCFFFRHNTNSTWSTQINTVPVNGSQTPTSNGVWITDDSSEELRNNTYCYQRPWVSTTGSYANATRTTYRPVFSKFYAGKCLNFSTAIQDFFNPAVVQRNDNDIYWCRWKNIIEELYNEQNKLLECKVYITPEEYKKIKTGMFVRIENVLYSVNKITDYNPAATDKPTKVELVQIKDINNYMFANWSGSNVYGD